MSHVLTVAYFLAVLAAVVAGAHRQALFLNQILEDKPCNRA
ncbi:hypothetical protein [Cupriavidus sp. Marseille-Q8015]